MNDPETETGASTVKIQIRDALLNSSQFSFNPEPKVESSAAKKPKKERNAERKEKKEHKPKKGAKEAKAGKRSTSSS